MLLIVALGLATARSQAQITLSNQTEAAGLSAMHSPDLTCPCSQSWMLGGMAVGDFNNDDSPDLFWIGGGETPDKLFINDGAGFFTDQAADWGLDELHAGSGASVGDFNNDGFLDIYVTSFGDPALCNPDLCLPWEINSVGVHRLYRNNGDGTFTDVAKEAGVNYSSHTVATGYGSAFGDYDLDGDLDLFVASWWIGANGNRLYRNEGDGTFTDVTIEALGTQVDNVWGFQPTFADMNGDLYPELLIAADFETSCYFVNNGDGTFTDVTAQSGTGLDDNGMGQTVADFNNDGLFDWYVTSIHSDNPEPTDNIGNMLYINLGNHQYEEVSNDVGANDGGWGWGTNAADLDLDGWLDIVEVNGRPGSSEWGFERAKLFHSLGNGLFEEIAEGAGLDHMGEGRAVVAFDADNDGDLDIAVTTNSGPFGYYRNETSNSGSWLRVTLDTSTNPLLAPNGFGSKIIATVGDNSYHRQINGNSSFLATGALTAHFGLGDARMINELRVIWSRGYETTLNNIAVNRHIVLTAPHLADVTADGIVDSSDLACVLGSWGPVQGSSNLTEDLNNDGAVGAADLAILLGSWGST